MEKMCDATSSVHQQPKKGIIIIIIRLFQTRGPYHKYNHTTQEHKK